MSAAFGFLCGEFRRLPKRFLRLLPLFLLLCAASLASLYAVASGAAQKETALRLALVNGDDSFLSRTAVASIAGNEAVSALFAVENCDEEMALAGLQSGRYAAAMLFSADFISGILDGDGNAVRIILSDAFRRNGALVSHTAATGEILMRTAEAAVNAAWQPLSDTLPAADAARAFERLELRCAVEFLTLPTAAFADETLSYSQNGLSLPAHYAACFAVLLLFLTEAVFAGDIREGCTYALFCRVRGLGVTNGAFLLGKCAVPFFCRFLLLCGLAFAAARAGLLTASTSAMFSALAGLLLLNLFLCALSVAALGTPLGAALPCAMGGICLFLCGGLLPLHLLPRTVAVLGAYTPFGAAYDLLAPLLGGDPTPRAAAVAVLYAAAAVLLAVRRLDRLVREGGLTV